MRSKRGQAAITAVMLIPMLGFAALSVDIGLQKTINTQMQASFDLAALSAAQRLDGTESGVIRSLEEATYVVSNNSIYFNYNIGPSEILYGKYEDEEFLELSSENFEEINAVKISGSHSYGSVLSHAAFGVEFLSSQAESIAIRPVGSVAKYVDCYLPFAIPSCHFNGLDGSENPPPISMDLTNLNTVGWGSPTSRPNTKGIIKQLGDQCSSGPASAYDEADGDTDSNNVYLSNGQNNAAVKFMSTVINDGANGVDPSEWPYEYFPETPRRNGVEANHTRDSDISSSRWGNNIGGVVPIVDASCGSNMTGKARIIGWTYAYIYDAKTKGRGGKNIWMQFDVVNEYDIGSGTVEDGVGNVVGKEPSKLVR